MVGVAVQKRKEKTIKQITERQTRQLTELIGKGILTGGVPAYLDVHLVKALGKDKTDEGSKWLIKTVQKFTTFPLSIDSDDPHLLEIGLKAYDYSKAKDALPIINSIREVDTEYQRQIESILSMKGRTPFKIILICGQYFQGDEGALTKSHQEKLGVAKRLIDLARSYSFTDDEIIVDPALTGFAICPRSAKECLKAISVFKQNENYRNIHTTLGLSQLIYLAAQRSNRSVLKAFLMELEKASISSVIMNPRDYNIEVNQACTDFVDELLKFPCKNKLCAGNVYDNSATCYGAGTYERIQRAYRALTN